MKKLTVLLICLLAANLATFAKDANQMKYLTLETFVASGSSTAIDVSDYKGNCAVVVNWATGANGTDGSYTGTVTFATSATSGGTYYTVTNLAGTAGTFIRTGSNVASVATFQIDAARLSPYVKATYANLHLTNAASVLFVAPMKSD